MGTPLPSLVSEEWRADSSLSQVTRLPWTQAGVPTGPSPAALTAAPGRLVTVQTHGHTSRGSKRGEFITSQSTRGSPAGLLGFSALGPPSPDQGVGRLRSRLEAPGTPGFQARPGWSLFPRDCGPKVPVSWPAASWGPFSAHSPWLMALPLLPLELSCEVGRLSALGLGERLGSPE